MNDDETPTKRLTLHKASTVTCGHRDHVPSATINISAELCDSDDFEALAVKEAAALFECIRQHLPHVTLQRLFVLMALNWDEGSEHWQDDTRSLTRDVLAAIDRVRKRAEELRCAYPELASMKDPTT
jgi:hypothetical protein